MAATEGGSKLRRGGPRPSSGLESELLRICGGLQGSGVSRSRWLGLALRWLSLASSGAKLSHWGANPSHRDTPEPGRPQQTPGSSLSRPLDDPGGWHDFLPDGGAGGGAGGTQPRLVASRLLARPRRLQSTAKEPTWVVDSRLQNRL